MKIYVATMQSESYEWVSTGTTEKQAKTALLKEWNKEQKAAAEWYGETFQPSLFKSVDDLDEWYGIKVYCLEPGQAERW